MVQALFLICGSRWWCQRSRHCFAVRWIMCFEIRVQFIAPYFFTSSAICQSKQIGKCCIRHILIRFLVAFYFAPFHLHLLSNRFLRQWDPGAYSNVAYTAILSAPFSETDIFKLYRINLKIFMPSILHDSDSVLTGKKLAMVFQLDFPKLLIRILRFSSCTQKST